MGILTKSSLRLIRDDAERTMPYNWLSESLRAKSRSVKYDETSIFLTHKHTESEELKSAIAFLSSMGVSVYVDWLDEGMPKKTSGETATKIKKKIKEKDKFVFLATEGAIESKWCNWELGFGDAQKYIQHIAILPVKDNYRDYSGTEYLSIYPYIYQSESFEGTYYVKYPDGDLVNLTKWLKT